MKKVLISFLILLLSVWLGTAMHNTSGYVLIVLKNLSIETSLWFAVIAILFLFILFYLLMQLGGKIKSIGSFLKNWWSNRRKRKARTQTMLGLCDFIEGNWVASEKKLSHSAKYGDMPLINYLAAAFVAQKQHAFKRRDEYLLLAQATTDEHPITIGLTQAHLQVLNKQWEEALATLQRLHKLRPKNALILQLLSQTCLKLKDWFLLKSLLPALHKYEVLSSEELTQLEVKTYSEILLTKNTNNTFESKWREVPNYLQKQPELVAIYVKNLLANNKNEEAENILKKVLVNVLDEKLLELYANVSSDNPIKKLTRAEKWYKNNPENAALLLCLGKMCKQQKLWGNARQYLEKSLSLNKNPTACFELGQLLEAQNDLRGALKQYTMGLHYVK